MALKATHSGDVTGPHAYLKLNWTQKNRTPKEPHESQSPWACDHYEHHCPTLPSIPSLENNAQNTSFETKQKTHYRIPWIRHQKVQTQKFLRLLEDFFVVFVESLILISVLESKISCSRVFLSGVRVKKIRSLEIIPKDWR